MTTTITPVPPRSASSKSELEQALHDLGCTRDELGRAREKIATLEQENTALTNKNAKLEAKVARLEREKADLLQQLYGQSSERRPGPDDAEAQNAPPLLAEPAAAPPAPPPPAPPEEPPPTSTPHGRMPLPDTLPREDVFLDPPESERRCPDCGGACVPFVADTTEILDLVPTALRVICETRRRWSCPTCQTTVLSHEPLRPIPRSRPSAALLAYVLTSKFADHIPLHRLAGIFARQDVEIARSTLGDWCQGATRSLKHVVDEIEKDVLSSPVVGMDETGIKVRDKTAPGNIRDGHFWLYRGERGDVVLKYTETKSGEHPAKVLESFEGTVQADAANSFDRLFEDKGKKSKKARDGKPRGPTDGRQSKERTEAGCNAHARRKAVKAEELHPVEAGFILDRYRELYAIEAEAKERGLDHEARKALRQERSRPIADQLFDYVRSLKPAAGTPLAAAVGYMLNNEAALKRFLVDGRVEIDNNNVERLFRLVAIGRRNYLFMGSPRGAEGAAIHYSIVASCRDLGIDPFAYLRDVLARLPTTPRSGVRELTPRRWLAAQEERA
jgi:transposase